MVFVGEGAAFVLHQSGLYMETDNPQSAHEVFQKTRNLLQFTVRFVVSALNLVSCLLQSGLPQACQELGSICCLVLLANVKKLGNPEE